MTCIAGRTDVLLANATKEEKMSTKIDGLLKELTLEEKASLCSGKDFWHTKAVERLGIPSIMVADGPHGLRKQEVVGDHVGVGGSIKATCFPTASATASSWDIDLMKQMGEALAAECLSQKVSVILGPGVNIKRSPLCGRNFEYISEDPFLTGKMAASLVNGIQQKGVGTSLKHFALNNQEYRRMATESVVDERTMREIYLPGFEEVVKEADPWTVMCAYNKIDNEYCSDNKKLLTDILKEEWGHTGIVVTDWGACNDRVAGIKAGMELEMPSSGGINDKLIVKAVKNGTLTMEELDKVVKRLLELIFKGEQNLRSDVTVDYEKHNDLARELAGKSAVLLKNNNSILPLNRDDEIIVIGDFAKTPRYQGAGSSQINPYKITSVLDELDKQGLQYKYCKGYDINSDEPDLKLIKEAVDMAKAGDKVVIIAGLTDDYESEGFDRQHLNMPLNHHRLIKKVAEVNKNTVVVLQNGAPVEMPWLDKVEGVLETYLSGQAGGSATVDLLYGDINPSGKLAETFPMKLDDDLASKYFGMGPKTVEYRESIYIGYRYYDTAKITPLFPFGYGLSYTTFEYFNLTVDRTEITDSDEVEVKFTVKNSGSVDGAEIIQLYVNDVQSTIFRPEQELKSFKKIYLKADEEQEVTMKLDKRSFAYYSIDHKDWMVETGEFEIRVGSSSRDIKLQTIITVNSTAPASAIIPDLSDLTPEYYNISPIEISDRTFETILCRPIPVRFRKRWEKYDKNSTLGDVKYTFVGKKIYNMVLKSFLHMGSEEIDPKMERMMKAIVEEMPLRSITLLGGGKMSFNRLEGVIAFINKNFFRGLFYLLRG